MDPVNRLDRLMEALRRQMAQSARRLDAAQQQTPGVTPRARSERSNIGELRSRIEERVRRIEPGSPERGRQARRIFLESVIAWEFGDELLLDSRLDRLIDRIEETVESDPELDGQFRDLLTELSGASI